MKTLSTLSIAAAGAALSLGAARAQDLGRKAPPQSRGIVLENATIHPVSGPVIENGALWFDHGVIRAVGPMDQVHADGDPEHLDLKGQHVYPGLISAVTTLGLVEIGQVRATHDEDEVGDLTPEVRASVAINPDSTMFPVTRSNGVLLAGVFPHGGLIPGRACVVQLDGWTAADMAVLDDAGVVVEWPALRPSRRRHRPGEADRAKQVEARRQNITDAFTGARDYLAARAQDPTIPLDLHHEALAKVLDRSRPVFLRAEDREQIETAVLWARENGVRPVIVGAREADQCCDLLVRNDVAVVVTGTHRLPPRRDSTYDQPFHLPAVLEAAGVRWCLASQGQFYNERNLPYEAGTAVAFGLPHDAALRAITASAADILGVADRYGTLEAGKSATLFVSTGDPLQIRSQVRMAFIDGRRIDLSNKQTELAAKYREKYRQLGLWPEKKAEQNGSGKD